MSSAPLATLLSTTPSLTALVSTLPANERYSYVFEGNSQTLDHIVVSQGLASVVDGFDVVHIDAEFADQVSDHDPSVARFSIDTTPPTVTCSVNPAALWPPNHELKAVTLTVNVSDSGSGPAGWKLISVTSNEPDTGSGDGDTADDVQGWTLGTLDSTGEVRAERSGSDSGRIYTFLVEGNDQQGNTTTCSTTVRVPQSQRGGGS